MSIKNQINHFDSPTNYVSFTKQMKGASSLEDFARTRDKVEEQTKLKNLGLTDEEITIYTEYNKGSITSVQKRRNIENTALNEKLQFVLQQINESNHKDHQDDVTTLNATSSEDSHPFDKLPLVQIPVKPNSKFYPANHPINHIKDLETDLFGHHSNDEIPSINKRRKLLRRIDRKLNKLSEEIPTLWKPNDCNNISNETNCSKDLQSSRSKESLWDVKDVPKPKIRSEAAKVIGPKPQTFYTVRNNKIVRLEKLTKDSDKVSAYETSDLLVPVNNAEKEILEGTKLTLNDIRSLPKFKDYDAGIPSKVLFVKNLANVVTSNDLQDLFNGVNLQSTVRLMSGRMRGQAFVTFQSEEKSTEALEQFNGYIFKGKPLIVQYGKGKEQIK